MQEKRRSRRKNVSIRGEIILDDMRCSGNIENISENGIYMEIESETALNRSCRFIPGTELRIHFQSPAGELLKLHCKVIWSYKSEPEGLTEKIGMEVIFPPPGFVEMYKGLK
jgi:hypothetical protein